MSSKNLRDLFVDQLRDLYDAEHQITQALPKMVEGASNEDLKEAFRDHLSATEGHIGRLANIFDELGEMPGGKTCKGMQGLIAEGEHAIRDYDWTELRDAALIAAAQRVEHYEIAGYGTVRAWAESLGLDEIAGMLDETAEEEGDANERLTDLAVGGFLSTGVNEAARQQG